MSEKLYIVRHGQTDYNAQGRYQGASDIPLNENGRKQARELREKLNPFGITLIISSPLSRASKTAEIVSQGEIKIITDPRLRERAYGIFEGLTAEEIAVKYPQFQREKLTRSLTKAPPGGETITQVKERVQPVIDETRERYQAETVAIVAHGNTSRVIHLIFNPGISEEELFSTRIGNAEFVTYDWSKFPMPRSEVYAR